MTESERTTVIGIVQPGSPAEKAGLLPGDKILSIDGHQIHRWAGQSEDSVTWCIASSEEPTIQIEILRDGQTKMLEARPEVEKTKWYQRRGLRQIQIGPMSRPMVAKTEPGSAAARAGFLPNDILTRVGGEAIYDDSTISLWARDHPGKPILITVERGEKRADGSVPTVPLTFEPKGFILSDVFADSPASRAGLQKGDRVISVDDNATPFAETFVEHIWAHDGKPVSLVIDRSGETKTIAVTPEVPLEGSKRASIGVALSRGDGLVFDEHGKMWPIHPTPGEQIAGATGAIFETFKKLSPTSKSNISIQHMGGPVMMMRVYYLLFESPQGWRLVLWFSVVINVNLALMNMLPHSAAGWQPHHARPHRAHPGPAPWRANPVGRGARPDRRHHARYRIHALRHGVRCAGSFRWEKASHAFQTARLFGCRGRERSGGVPSCLTAALRIVCPESEKLKQVSVLSYCPSPFTYRRRPTREVRIGHVGVGGDNPIRVQSMITCDTMDTAASIQQTLDLANVGCEIVRITAPTVKDAANLQHIVAGLR